MLQNQFISRLILIVFFGIIYILAMKKMAGFKSMETIPKRHIVMKVIGAVFIISAIACLCFGTYALTQINFPERTIDLTYNPNQIVHPFGSIIIWGYPTIEQNQALMSITNIFASVALAAYCFFFRKADRKWWKKILWFFYGLFMYSFYCSATNLHYFDMPEFVAPLMFCVMAGFVLLRANKQQQPRQPQKVQTTDTSVNSTVNEFKKTDETSYMPQNIVSEIEYTPVTKPTDNSNNLFEDEQKKEVASVEQAPTCNDKESISDLSPDDKTNMIKYCRFCGNPIGYDSHIFCKHCGKRLV